MTTINTSDHAHRVADALDQIDVTTTDIDHTTDTITLTLADVGGTTSLHWDRATGWTFTSLAADGTTDDAGTLPVPADASPVEIGWAVLDELPHLVHADVVRSTLEGLFAALAPILRL